MILNACVKAKTMVDETICKSCKDRYCRHAGEPTTHERLDMYERIDEAQAEHCAQTNCLGCDLNPGNYKLCEHFYKKKKAREKVIK